MKKRNKIISIVMLSLLVIGVVSAVLAPYFGSKLTTLDVSLPILVTGNAPETISGGYGCEQVTGTTPITIENFADQKTDIEITSECREGEEICEDGAVETSYMGTLELAQKVVVFGSEPWTLLSDGETATVEYTVVGDSFTAEVTTGAIDGYVLIYYKDNSDRFDEPAEAILVEGNSFPYLPYKADKNSAEDGTYDYCTIEGYDTCHGAKLWYIPSEAMTGSVIDWARAGEFLFETELIQYSKEGEITMYPLSSLVINPVFDLDCMLEGTVVINTTIDNVENV